MSHEFESGFFVGQPAWHGLGTVLDAPPTITEAISASGLDWTVRLDRVRLAGADGAECPDHRATVRSSDGRVLGIVGLQYHPLQNIEAFQFFQPFVDSGACSLEAAGSLKEGARVWVLARVNPKSHTRHGGDGHGVDGQIGNDDYDRAPRFDDDADRDFDDDSGDGPIGAADITPGDEVRQYVLLSNGHDGGAAIRVGFTTVRVVCWNTLTIAHTSAGSKLLKIRHTKSANEALAQVRNVMDLVNADFAATVEQMRLLTLAGCDPETLQRYVREVISPLNVDDRVVRGELEIVRLYEGGRGAADTRPSMWRAFNALTEYVTHERGTNPAKRLDSQWFGQGAQVIDRAFIKALEYARRKLGIK